MPATDSPDVLVVGGGAIGLAVADRLQAAGRAPLVLDPGEPRGAWHVAAGMLAPVAEAEFGEDALLALALESARRYPAFADRLGVPLRSAGTLLVARDGDEAAELDRLLAFRQRLGLPVRRLLASAARRAEPALAPTVRLALDVPDDHAVDPRALHAALAARTRGLVRPARVARVGDGEVTLEDGERLAAEHVVVCAGAWSGGLLDGVPVRPVGGQVLRLRDPRGGGLVEHVIRGAGTYLVPRGDGRYVLGATVEERGFDVAPTAEGVYELLRDMSEVVPGVLELEIEELLAGVRPGTPDNLPLIGPAPGCERTLLATGHHRNGILLAPLTADLISALIDGEPAADDAELLRGCDPRRFEAVPA